MSLDTLKENIKVELKKYSKKELLIWLSATSILPGNELFQYRFVFLELLTSSIEDNEFQNKPVDSECINKLLLHTKDDIWAQCEDWKPIPNSKSNYVSIDKNQYYFITGDVISTHDTIRCIVKRLFEFDNIIKQKYAYSIKEELIKILTHYTSLINFIDVNKEKYYSSGEFSIPDASFIDKYQPILHAYEPNKSLFRSKQDFNIVNLESITNTNSLLSDRAYLPFMLLIRFYNQTCDDLQKDMDIDIILHLNNQLKLDIFESLCELFPRESIMPDVKLNDITESLDFCILVENYALAFKCVSGTPSKRMAEYSRLKSYFEQVKKVENNSKIQLNIMNTREAEYSSNPVKVIPIIVDDDLFNNENDMFLIDYKTVLVSYNDLRHVCEDITDRGEDDISSIDLLSVFKQFVNSQSPITLVGGFIGFYLMMLKDPKGLNIVDSKGYAAIFTLDIKVDFLIKKYEKRPLLDLSPFETESHYYYKIVKDSDLSCYGYNPVIKENFWCYLGDNNVYVVISGKKFHNYNDKEVAIFLFHFFRFYILKILGEIPISKTIIHSINLDLMLKKDAIAKKLVKEGNYPFMMLCNDEGDNIFVFDSTQILKDFSNEGDKLLEFFADKFIKPLLDTQYNAEVNHIIKEHHPQKYFGMQNTKWVSDPESRTPLFPSNIKISEVELLLLREFRDINEGVHEDNDAKTIINKICEFLDDIIGKYMQKLDLLKFIKFGYSEIENSTKVRKKSILRHKYSKNLELEYDSNRYTADFELKMQAYNPSCRYLVEKAVLLQIKGHSEVTASDWQFLCALTMKLITLVNTSDMLHSMPNLTKVKIVKEKELFDIKLIKIPTRRYLNNFASVVKDYNERDSLETDDLSDAEKNVDENTFKKLIDEGSLKPINDKLETAFGFKLYSYFSVIEAAIQMQDQNNKSDITPELIDIPRQELIDKIAESTKLSKNVVEGVINFSTLYYDGTEPLELWKVNTRRNRLTIRAFINYENRIIYGPEMTFIMEEIIIHSIIDGGWPYNREFIDRELEAALRARQLEISKSFEEDMLKKISKLSDFHEGNICQNKNDKCVKDIKEKCPGQIDILSVHKNKKLIVVWDAKNKEARHGSKELMSDYKEITSKYMKDINAKTDFINRNKKDVLDYYNILEHDGWKVLPCIILSSDNLLKSLLEQEFPVISYNEINSFLDRI